MAYTIINFKTKKALKEAIAKFHARPLNPIGSLADIFNTSAPAILCYQPGLGPDLSNYTGKVSLEGPHYPKPHSWYSQAELINGIVVKVS